LELAKKLGATHTIDTSSPSKGLVEIIHDMTDGAGTTITVDATGVVALIKQGLEFTANEGKVILLGVAPAEAELQIPIVSFMVVSRSLSYEEAS